jgi:hypothetical protein
MKNCLKFIAVGGLWLLSAATPAPAQNDTVGPVPTRPRERVGRSVLPEPSPTAVDQNQLLPLNTRPLRPERNELPLEVQRRIERFKRDARAYLEQQEALRKALLGATDEERAKIREQLRTLREAQLERAREQRKLLEERLTEIRRKLRGHGEVFDSLKSSTRDSAQQSLQQATQEAQQQTQPATEPERRGIEP